MATTKTNWFKLSLILLAALHLSACGQTADNVDQGSSSVPPATSTPAIISTPAVTSTADSTSQDTAPEEPEFRGNEDYFSFAEQIPYENGDGITFEVLSDPFKLGDSQEKLGVRIVSIDENLYIMGQGPRINIEKKINGEWVRLEIDFGEHSKSTGSADEGGQNRRNEILNHYNIYHLFDCEITPALSAGEYRFIAYFYVKRGWDMDAIEKGTGEVRQYHIPFTVTE